MSAHSSIEWTDSTWNPIRARNRKTNKVGWHCEHATTGCEFCYAESMNRRLGTGLPFKPGHRNDIEVFLDQEMLTAPLRWKRPRKIFVCSMTDLFAEFVNDEWIDRMFAVMALCPQHTFQVLTKRAERMQEWFRCGEADERAHYVECEMEKIAPQHWCARELEDFGGWPLKNVWLGVSAERQQEWNERKEHLRNTPAAVRFVSMEPLIGRIDACEELGIWWNQTTWKFERHKPSWIDWIIVGGESGPGARPMHPDWARDLRDQCAAAGVPYFFKQWGQWAPVNIGEDFSFEYVSEARLVSPCGKHVVYSEVENCDFSDDSLLMERVGKKAAGRLLDGQEHSAFPAEKKEPASVTEGSLWQGGSLSHDPNKAGATS